MKLTAPPMVIRLTRRGGQPGTFARDDEMEALAAAVQEAGGGVMELVTDAGFFGRSSYSSDAPDEYAAGEKALFERLAREDVPVIFNCHPLTADLDAGTFSWLEAVAAQGKDIRGVVSTKAINLLISTESNTNPFRASETYRGLAKLPLLERVVELARPAVGVGLGRIVALYHQSSTSYHIH
jgi:hypothetical protein